MLRVLTGCSFRVASTPTVPTRWRPPICTSGDYAELSRRVCGYAPRSGRTVFVLEGGYDLEALRVSTGAVLAAALDEPVRADQPSSGGPGDEAVARAKAVQERLLATGVEGIDRR